MKLKDIFCIEAVKLGAAVETYFNSAKHTITITDDFTFGAVISDKLGNTAYIPFSNIKHFSPEVKEPVKSKKSE